MGSGTKKSLGGLVRRAARRGQRLVSGAKGKTARAPSNGGACVAFVRPDGERIEASSASIGTTILDVAKELDIDLDHFCGGQCSCGTCRIKVLNGEQNLSARQGSEELVLGQANVAAGNRLACQAKVHGPVEIEIPRWF